MTKVGSGARTTRPGAATASASFAVADEGFYTVTGDDLVVAVSNSGATEEILRLVEKVAATDSRILLVGESGTGKELIARAIHQSSGRSERALIRVNCAAVPRELFESEFFGHVKGAFTGAVRDRAGRFELANGGTLFLDEVGELPAAFLPVRRSEGDIISVNAPVAVQVAYEIAPAIVPSGMLGTYEKRLLNVMDLTRLPLATRSTLATLLLLPLGALFTAFSCASGVTIVALGGFLMGFDASVISGVVTFIEPEFGLSNIELGWAVASLTLTATLAMMVSGPLSDRFGRRAVLKWAAVLFSVSAVASGISK